MAHGRLREIAICLRSDIKNRVWGSRASTALDLLPLFQTSTALCTIRSRQPWMLCVQQLPRACLPPCWTSYPNIDRPHGFAALSQPGRPGPERSIRIFTPSAICPIMSHPRSVTDDCTTKATADASKPCLERRPDCVGWMRRAFSAPATPCEL